MEGRRVIHLVKPGHIKGSTWPTMCGLTVHKTLASIFRSSVTCQNCLDDSTLAAPATTNQAQASKSKEKKPRYKPEDFDWG